MILKGQRTCRHCGIGAFSKKILDGLNALDELLSDDYIITISSGYRCKFWNEHEGGHVRSRHMTGEAVDFRCNILDVQGLLEVVMMVPEFANGGIGVYDNFIHVDVGRKSRWRYKGGEKVPWDG